MSARVAALHLTPVKGLRVTPRAVTALVDGLVETGFVTREPCPTDRRATLVTFTELGRSTAQNLADSHRELARQLFGRMSAEEFDGFDTGLSQVLDQLRAVLAAKAQAPAAEAAG